MEKIRVGVVGVGRGGGFARTVGPFVGMELVALCDTWEERLQSLGKELEVATYTDYDRFLELDGCNLLKGALDIMGNSELRQRAAPASHGNRTRCRSGQVQKCKSWLRLQRDVV